jgi:protease II
MNIVQEIIKKYLKAEESAVNERIKEYTAKQQELFSSLKARAFQDKTAIFR